jgi:hypothetical protein
LFFERIDLARTRTIWFKKLLYLFLKF